MAKTKVIAVANQKGGVGKSTSVYCIGTGLAQNGNKVLLLDVDRQGDLTKMLGERKPHELPLTLSNVMNDIVAENDRAEYPEIMHHKGDKLKEKEAWLKELNILLNMDQKDCSLIDDVAEEDSLEKPRARDYEW